MTGEPSYKFRGKGVKPICKKCKSEMEFFKTINGPFGEEDLWVCPNCKEEYLDFWSY